MVSYLESLVFMAVVAAIGGAVAVVVNNAAAPLITAIFAYVGILLVFAGIAVVLLAILCLSLYGDAEPPRSFQLSLVGVMILLGIPRTMGHCVVYLSKSRSTCVFGILVSRFACVTIHHSGHRRLSR